MIKHHDIKAHREVEVKFNTFLILALNEMGCKFQSLATFDPLSMKLVPSVDLNMKTESKITCSCKELDPSYSSYVVCITLKS